MLKIRKMDPEDAEAVFEMAVQFYNSPAVHEPVSESILKATVNHAVSPAENFVGYVFLEDGVPVGFAYLTIFFETEVGGMCVMIEDLFFQEQCRGKGYGKAFFAFLFEEYADAKRFRLEVTPDNEAAIGLYAKMGFEPLEYAQMVINKR